ncbi:hypothetical protein PAAG_06148 [Paracoccidioides lutzii Pb01]|uniref:Uncharacterized protein n=1 Tax=Paracoccidioides lutzii (strain ATCC MYA-826 / Pb01) TaxID=502779 RepID=C1H638_PARBA|nr:hypothetical protein PAAG_06148 [Paracoccidioides lutzii Pb01]EEH35101.1 hypothetical protein PAAG_06148 [Paracoccidioides lutzii Pb01]
MFVWLTAHIRCNVQTWSPQDLVASSPTEPIGRSRDEIIAVGKRASMSLPDKRPLTRGGSIQVDTWNNSLEEVSQYGPCLITAASTHGASYANTLDFIRFLECQHEPMHHSAPYQIVAKLLKSGRKRLRQLENNTKSKTWRKNNAAAKSGNHVQTESPKSRMWRTTPKARKKRDMNEEVELHLSEDEQRRNPQRRKLMVAGTRTRRESRLIDYKNRDFLYPGIGRLPSLSPEHEKTTPDKNCSENDGQNLMVRRLSQQRRTPGEVRWQARSALTPGNQNTLGRGVESAEGSTIPRPSSRNADHSDNEPHSYSLVLESPEARDAGVLSAAPNGCHGSIPAERCSEEGFPEENKIKPENSHHPEESHLKPCLLQETVAAGSSTFSAFPPLQPQFQDKNNPPPLNNTGPAPQSSEILQGITPVPAAWDYKVKGDTETTKTLPCPPSDSSHIDLQCLPPRSSSKGACCSSSLFAAFNHHHQCRGRTSNFKSRGGFSPAFPRNSTDVQSLISLFPRPGRWSDASRSAVSMPSLDKIQQPHAVTSTPNEPKMANRSGNRISLSKKSPLAVSPLQQEPSPSLDMTFVQAPNSYPSCLETGDHSHHILDQAKITNTQEQFTFAGPMERRSMESNVGRRLTPKASSESKKLFSWGTSEPLKVDTTKPLDQMSRAERVFALRMRDVCAVRECTKKDAYQAPALQGSTSEGVRSECEQPKDLKQTKDRPSNGSMASPKARCNDAPGSPPSMPLPADPPIHSLRSSTSKTLLIPNQLVTLSPSTVFLDATTAHKAEVRVSSSSGSTHRSNSNKSLSSRSARSATDIPHQHRSTQAEHQISRLELDGPREEMITSGVRPLTPQSPPVSTEEHASSLDCDPSRLRTNPSPKNNNRKNTFYKGNNSDIRIDNPHVSQSPLRERFSHDIPSPPSLYQHTTPLHSNNTNSSTSTNSNRNSASNHTQSSSSSQSLPTRPRTQDPTPHSQCEARIAFLERQNKMLQAALIAALEVGVTFDADLMRSVTSTPPVSVASPSSDINKKDTYRCSYASVSTAGTTRTNTSSRRSMEGRRSYISDRSIEAAANVVRSQSVRDARTRQYAGESYRSCYAEKKIVSDVEGSGG